MNEINLEDCRDTMSRMADNSVDSIVTDPPYELGFMGKDWDNTGIAYDVDMWAECLRVLKPGGYLMAFGGSRTHHRIMVAIEDAGFQIRDTICWAFGSGFPKSLNIGKAVDKLQGNEREETDYIAPDGKKRTYGEKAMLGGLAGKEIKSGKNTTTKGTSKFEGWGTALKPAVEYICMARKPLSEKTVAENVLKWGTGGINIDECRIDVDAKDKNIRINDINPLNPNSIFFKDKKLTKPRGAGKQGRFPANICHDNSEEVRECFPETKTNSTGKNDLRTYKNKGQAFSRSGNVSGYEADSGNASRFFKSIIYQAKASKSERNKGCEGLEEKERIDYGGFHSEKGLIENNRNPENRKPTTNNHPTVKPIALMEYLIKMVTKPNGIVYDPFGGSGTTACACILNGYSYILSEMEANHVEIIKARTQHYKKQHTQTTLF